MAFDTQLAARIRAVLARKKNIDEKQLFGGIGFLLNGNVLVGVWKDSMIVRIGPDAYAHALSTPHVREFDITGRPMKGWVMVGPEGEVDEAMLQGWIGQAMAFVKSLPKK